MTRAASLQVLTSVTSQVLDTRSPTLYNIPVIAEFCLWGSQRISRNPFSNDRWQTFKYKYKDKYFLGFLQVSSCTSLDCWRPRSGFSYWNCLPSLSGCLLQGAHQKGAQSSPPGLPPSTYETANLPLSFHNSLFGRWIPHFILKQSKIKCLVSKIDMEIKGQICL